MTLTKSKRRKVHRVFISQSSTHTFADVDFIVYCQKALFSKDIWKITIEDWPSGYCEAYLDTMRQHHRWKKLTLRYEAKGNYIYVCRTLTKDPKLAQRPHRKITTQRKKKSEKNSFALSAEWEDSNIKC